MILVFVVGTFGCLMSGLWGTDAQSKSVYFDSFNVLNTLFSGLAFAGVIFAILLQRYELRLQREELEATRAELRRSAEAQEQSQAALKEQVIALNETVRISQESLQPQVIVYSAADESRPSFILLIIENIGRGVARNVRFASEKQLPSRAFGIDAPSSDRDGSGVMDNGPLATGIPFLPPGGKRRFAWGQYGGLHAAIGDDPIKVVANFDNVRGEAQPPIDSLVDVKSFEHTDAVDPDGARQAARHLEQLVRDFGRMASGFSPPVVLIQSKARYDRQKRQAREAQLSKSSALVPAAS